MEEKQRIFLWDNLKLFLIVLVVITHCVNVYQLQGEYWIQFFWVFIMTFTMPLFTLISGFFYKERCLKYSVSRFLYPCLVFSLVNYLIGIPSGAYPNGITFKSGWAMWYLWALFIYNIITPHIMKKIDEKKLVFVAFCIAFLCGFKFFPNSFLDACRVVFFYPFFALGIYLRKNPPHITKKIGVILMVICLLAYICTTIYFNGFPYGSGFMGTHGFSLFGIVSRWTNYVLTTVMSISLICIVPNKKYWFTEYGSRTMNVYLLHMAIVFPLCWFLLRPIMHDWYGYILYSLIIPVLIITSLLPKYVDKMMQVVLALPQFFFKKN